MRKVSIAATFAMPLLLAACGGAGEPQGEATEAATPADAAEPTADPVVETATDAVTAPPVVATSEAVVEAVPTAKPAKPTAAPVAAATHSVKAAVEVAKAPAAFNQCKVCHSVEKGKHGIGPSLAGIFGTKAADIPGFEFSTPMKESGLTWNEATLDSYLKAPMKMVPGTKMSFAGVANDAKRKEIIDYLKSL